VRTTLTVERRPQESFALFVGQGSDAGQALRNALDLARHAEALGYARHWMAEHHNMPGIASAATAVALGEAI